MLSTSTAALWTSRRLSITNIGAGSQKAVDAFVIAVADLWEGAVVATVDTADLDQLATHASTVVIADIEA